MFHTPRILIVACLIGIAACTSAASHSSAWFHSSQFTELDLSGVRWCRSGDWGHWQPLSNKDAPDMVSLFLTHQDGDLSDIFCQIHGNHLVSVVGVEAPRVPVRKRPLIGASPQGGFHALSHPVRYVSHHTRPIGMREYDEQSQR